MNQRIRQQRVKRERIARVPSEMSRKTRSMTRDTFPCTEICIRVHFENMSLKSRYRHIRRKGKVKAEPQGYKKDANAVYRGILRDRAHRYEQEETDIEITICTLQLLHCTRNQALFETEHITGIR